MSGLDDFRAQYPDYKDVPDGELADALYSKFYSAIPRDEFDAKVGVSGAPAITEPASLGGPKKQAEVRAYEPSIRDRIASMLMPDDPRASPFQAKAVEALTGSRGLGHTEFSAADVFPPTGVLFSGDEALRDAQKGDYKGALINAAGVIPAEGAAAKVALARAASAKPGAAVAQTAANVAIPASRDALLEASERQAIPVPNFVATDSTLAKKVAGGISGTPFIGDPITSATANMAERMGSRVEELGSNATREASTPGALAKQGIADWTDDGFRQEMNKAYEPLDGLINKDHLVSLERTRVAAGELTAKDIASASKDGQKVIDLVRDALNRPQGLTWDGLKELRTRVGERVHGEIAPEAGTSARALDKIYAALTEDVRHGVGRAGTTGAGGAGQKKALAAFDAANEQARNLFETRRALTDIIGTKGDAPAESVFHRVIAMAGSTASQDTAKLLKARQAIGSNWKDVTDSVVTRLGMDERTKMFSPERFLTDYEKRLSENGRNILFGPETKAHLDDIARLAKAYSLNARYGNPSGTGRSVAVTATLAAAWAHPLYLLGEAVTGNVLARMLARPAQAKSIAAWMKAYSTASQSQTPGAMAALQRASDQVGAAAGAMSRGAGAELSQPETFEDALKLPKGTRFVDPNGVERVR